MYWLLQHSANSALDCAYSWSYGVKVATFIRTWWNTRVLLASLLAVFAGYDAPRAVFPSIVALADEARGGSTGAVLVPGVLPVVIASGAFVQTAKKTVEIPQLPFFDKVVHISCRGAEADSCGPTVCRTTVFPLLLDTVVDVTVVKVVQLPRWFAVHGHAGDMPVVVNNRCLELDSAEKLQRFRSCSSSMVVDFPVVAQRQIPWSRLFVGPLAFPSC